MKKALSFILTVSTILFTLGISPASAAAPQFTAARPTFLYGGGISSSVTSIKLTSLLTPDGTPITTAQLVGGVGSVFYITIEPATTKKETVSCTAVTQNADNTALLTGCTRGLQFTYPYTASASLAISHAGGSSVVLSDSPQLYNDIIAYVNASLAAGVNNASLIAKGIVQLATPLQQASSTAIGGGSTDAPLALYSTNATSSRGNGVTSQLKVVVTQNNAKIDPNFIDTTGLTFASTTAIGSFPAYQIGKNIKVITTTATSSFAIPSGITKLYVRGVAAGGGGGTCSSAGGTQASGGGGGGGGYFEKFVDVTGTTSVQVFVGVGGASVTAGSWTTFGTNGFYLSANGGLAGTAESSGGVGGTATGGDINISGQQGWPGFSDFTATNAIFPTSAGGNSQLGQGGIPQLITNNTGTGSTGSNYGAGAGGGVCPSGSVAAGGTGAQGALIISW